MPYFFILPVYVLLLLGLGIVAFITRRRPVAGYLVAGALGSIPGLIVANVMLTLAGLVPALVAERCQLPEWLENGCKAITLAALILGPFAASAAGVLLGFFVACRWFRKRRSANSGNKILE